MFNFNPKNWLGGGGLKGLPPSTFRRDYSATRKALAATLYDFFLVEEIPAHFDTKFVTPGGTVLKLRNFLYMHVGPKMAPKWLKLICFNIIVLQKVSATNFTEKTTKNKRSKKLRNT